MAGEQVRVASALSPVSPQDLHRRCTTAAGCPQNVDGTCEWAPLRCRTVSQTPTYDQLRGERINADVPAGEPDPRSVDRPGKHRRDDDTPIASAVHRASLGPRTDLAEGWSWFSGAMPGAHHVNSVKADTADVTTPDAAIVAIQN